MLLGHSNPIYVAILAFSLSKLGGFGNDLPNVLRVVVESERSSSRFALTATLSTTIGFATSLLASAKGAIPDGSAGPIDVFESSAILEATCSMAVVTRWVVCDEGDAVTGVAVEVRFERVDGADLVAYFRTIDSIS